MGEGHLDKDTVAEDFALVNAGREDGEKCEPVY